MMRHAVHTLIAFGLIAAAAAPAAGQAIDSARRPRRRRLDGDAVAARQHHVG